MLKNLVCLAQARVIGGNKKTPHICSICIDQENKELVRVCLPFAAKSLMPIRRWSEFTCDLEKQSSDSRKESYFINLNGNNQYKGDLSASRKNLIHKQLAGFVKDEEILISEGSTIGVKLIKNVKLSFQSLSEKHVKIKQVMESKYGLWYSEKAIRIVGEDFITSKKFNRLLLDWNFAEAYRKINDASAIKEILQSYKYPYLITGTTLQRRKSFMAISVLSSKFLYA